MKRVLISILVLLIASAVFSQKADVQIAKSPKAQAAEWQILDTDLFPVVSGSHFSDADSVSFGLEANRRYYFEVSLTDTIKTGSILFRLYINSEAVLLISSDLPPGDHFYSFFTGIRHEPDKITGGTDADISQYPWQVFYEAGNYVCGGSIISGDWIITAAHCTEDDFGNPIPISEMDVRVGSNHPRAGTDGKLYRVSRVIRHENYNGDTYFNDIALLKLSETINYTNATPIRLISKIDSAAGATDPGVMAWLTGYGLTQVSPEVFPATLQKVQLPIVSVKEASTVWGDIPSSDLMAGYRTGNKDACSGDSGGPFVVPVDGEYKLAGIVSWGSSNCNTYGAYTRIANYESWINSKTGIEITYFPPVPSGDSIVCQGATSGNYSVEPIDGTSEYEWQLTPAAAGSIQGNSEQSSVTWNIEYTGIATIKLRVTRYGFVSYWSALTVNVAKYNKLLGSSEDTIICAGQPVTLKVLTEGYNLSYSWYKGDSNIQSGTSPQFFISASTTDNTGLYRCDINGSCGEGLSASTNLVVFPVTKIKNISPDTVANFGEDITLEVDTEGHNLLYQWQKDGGQLSEGTAPAYSLINVNASNTGLYSVLVTGTCGEMLSSNIYLDVINKEDRSDPQISVWPTLVSDEFNVAISNDQSYTLMLFNNAGRLMMEKQNCQYKTTLNIAYFSRGIYILTVSGNNFRKSVKLIRN
jgi:hypothetical protein